MSFRRGLQDVVVTVTPEGALDVAGACGTDCVPGAHEIITFNNVVNTCITLAVEKKSPR